MAQLRNLFSFEKGSGVQINISRCYDDIRMRYFERAIVADTHVFVLHPTSTTEQRRTAKYTEIKKKKKTTRHTLRGSTAISTIIF